MEYEEIMLVCTICLSPDICGILYVDLDTRDRWICNNCGHNQVGLVSRKQWEGLYGS